MSLHTTMFVTWIHCICGVAFVIPFWVHELKHSFLSNVYFQFSHDSDTNVEEVDMMFMHRKYDGHWDWPKKRDEKRIKSKFVIYGPCLPEPPSKKGFRFPDDEAEKAFKVFKSVNNTV